MSATPHRPHCRVPAACTARGAGHCRACACAETARIRFSDPEQVELQRQRFVALNRDPAVRAKQVAATKSNKAGMARIRRVARAKLKRAAADPAAVARREAGKAAAIPRQRMTMARKLAEAAGFPVELVAEYRALRRSHKLRRAEAVQVLRVDHPAAFAAIDAKRRREAIRAIGPAPAIGMPDRAAWTRRYAAISAGLEARP